MPLHAHKFRWIISDLLQPDGLHWALPCAKWGALSPHGPGEADWSLAELTMQGLEHQQERSLLASFEGPRVHALLRHARWIVKFGTIDKPKPPWRYIEPNQCCFHLVSPDPVDQGMPMKKGLIIMSNFPMEHLNVRCRAALLNFPVRDPVIAVVAPELEADTPLANVQRCSFTANDSDTDSADDELPVVARVAPDVDPKHHMPQPDKVTLRRLEFAVKNHTFKGTSTRTNLTDAPRVGRFLLQKIPSDRLSYGLIFNLVLATLPEDIRDWITAIALNKFIDASQCIAHLDSNNTTWSYFIMFGDFIGGALALASGPKFGQCRRWYRFQGNVDKHWIEDFVGDRWSIVAYGGPQPASVSIPARKHWTCHIPPTVNQPFAPWDADSYAEPECTGGYGTWPSPMHWSYTPAPPQSEPSCCNVSASIHDPTHSGSQPQFTPMPNDAGGVETNPPLSTEERSALYSRMTPLVEAARIKWSKLAKDKCWTEVRAPLKAYQYAEGGAPLSDPRLPPEYATRIIAVLGLEPAKDLDHLSSHDIVAVVEVYRRKAGAFHLEGTPRTCLQGFLNDTVVSGPPVRGHPIRSKGDEGTFIRDALDKEVAEGYYTRGASPWGSWAFATRPTPGGRRRRTVVDYRKVNGRIVKSIYYIRRCQDIKDDLAGSAFLSSFDGLRGFNLLRNTKFSKLVLAILADSGCHLPECLQLGGANGPFDFQNVVDETFTMSPPQYPVLAKVAPRPAWYGRQWKNYLDDFCIRTGRWNNGSPCTDADYEARLRVSQPPPSSPRSLGDSLDVLGLVPAAEEPYKGHSRAKPSTSASVPVSAPTAAAVLLALVYGTCAIGAAAAPITPSVTVVVSCGRTSS